MYNIIPLFPTLLYHNNYDINIEELIKYCYEQKELDKSSKYPQRSGQGSWQSLYLNTQLLNPLKEKVNGILKEVCRRPTFHHPDWVNINPPGATNVYHTHPNSDYSCVYYLKNEADTGIMFVNPMMHLGAFNTTTFTNKKLIDDTRASPQYKVVPKRGDLLMFPAYLPHWVEKNEGTEDRLTIAWNISMQINPQQDKIGPFELYW
tara:strand:+ start:292 stop:906 length:615 start_codon:yes stop_codon:yes gene_type:complete